MKNLAIVGLGIQGKRLLRDFSKISNVVGCTSIGKKENIQWLKKTILMLVIQKILMNY